MVLRGNCKARIRSRYIVVVRPCCCSSSLELALVLLHGPWSQRSSLRLTIPNQFSPPPPPQPHIFRQRPHESAHDRFLFLGRRASIQPCRQPYCFGVYMVHESEASSSVRRLFCSEKQPQATTAELLEPDRQRWTCFIGPNGRPPVHHISSPCMA
jgi:hypothetical protein